MERIKDIIEVMDRHMETLIDRVYAYNEYIAEQK